MRVIPDSYFYGETSGRVKATELRPKALGKMLSRADNVLFVLASEVEDYPMEIVGGIIEESNATVYKTEYSATTEWGIEADGRYALMEIVDLLCNEMKDEFDYIVLVGVPYHIETRVLSGLRACDVGKVVTLDWRHQQYADFSFRNITDPEEFEKELKEILDNV